ncbi:MAG TPA: hypothetical protein VK975_05835, partial [Acidimicrobiales bacterium]|nr:hypothetical protein [Acidimicrobiales bacterium]
ETVGVRLFSSGVEVCWPPADPAHEIDSGPPPVTLDVGVSGGAGGLTIGPRRAQLAVIGLTALTLLDADGASWLDDREVVQIAGHLRTAVIAARDAGGGVTLWDVDRRTSTRLDVGGAEAVALAASRR